MDFEAWEFHPSKLPKGIVEKEQFIKKIKVRFKRELQKKPDVKAWLAQYDPGSAERFLDRYAKRKASLVEHADYHIREMEAVPELRFRSHTEQALDMILQKKLFNIFVLWDANQVKLPGIRTHFDFMVWDEQLRNCPFLEPVTEQEIRLMQQYLVTDNARLEDCLGMTTTLSRFRGQNGDGQLTYYPDWFDYYDGHMGTGALLSLPSLRVPLDNHYHSLGAKPVREERAAAREPETPSPPSLPFLHSGFDEMYQFATLFDDAYFQRLLKHELDHIKSRVEMESQEEEWVDVDWLIIELRSISNPPPVRGGVSWRMALQQCYNDYLHRVVADELPIAYDEYLFKIETGLAEEKNKHHDFHQELANTVYEMVLKGRELSGEPRDTDY